MPDIETVSPFVESAYRDTYDLLVSLRDYISGPMEEEAAALDSSDRLHLVRVMSRITRQMTDVMAWLMLQKAVTAGELSSEAAGEEAAATFEEFEEESAFQDAETLSRMPIAVRGHMDRCRRITALVCRLKG